MATVNKIIDQVLRRLAELRPDQPEHWSRDEIADHVNDAVTELNLIACEIQKVLTVLLNTTDNIYALDTTTIAPLSTRWINHYLLKYSLSALDAEAQWDSAGANRMRPRIWVPFGLTQILIYPRPLAAAYLHVESLVMPATVTDDDVSLEVRSEYEPAVEDFSVHRAMFKEGGAEAQQMEIFYQQFLDSVQFLASVNLVRSFPGWEIAPEALLDPASPREGGGD